MEDTKKRIEDILTRGVGELIDPDGVFRKKLTDKAAGKYDRDIIVKFGVDPTRSDVHLGHAVVLRKLRQLQDLGCKVVFLVGDFTARIGDPSGRSKTRPEIEQKKIEENMMTYVDQVNKILSKEESVFSWIRNSDWFVSITDLNVPDSVTYTDNKTKHSVVFPANSFHAKTAVYDNTRMQIKNLKKKEVHNITLRSFLSVMRNITHGQLIQRDMFQRRIKNGDELYMHEMLYPVLQGVDSFVLHKIYGSCDLEIGGTDQTFNMLMGRTVMKTGKQEPQAVVSMELLEGTGGKEKMSKSLDNYIAITDEPADMYGKIMSIPDSSIAHYYELCTFTPLEDVKSIEKEIEKGKANPRDIKMELAKQIVAIYHGKEKAQTAQDQFVKTFQKKEIPTKIPEVFAEKGEKLVDIITKSKIAASKTEARRLISEGAVKDMATGEKITDTNYKTGDALILKIGKRHFVKIVVA